jgi:hypothetical protein
MCCTRKQGLPALCCSVRLMRQLASLTKRTVPKPRVPRRLRFIAAGWAREGRCAGIHSRQPRSRKSTRHQTLVSCGMVWCMHVPHCSHCFFMHVHRPPIHVIVHCVWFHSSVGCRPLVYIYWYRHHIQGFHTLRVSLKLHDRYTYLWWLVDLFFMSIMNRTYE